VDGLPGQDWALRVTLVIRKDGERWLLVHRHADPLIGAISVAQSAALARAPR
jgi:ketosteroid isomerase-like protein